MSRRKEEEHKPKPASFFTSLFYEEEEVVIQEEDNSLLGMSRKLKEQKQKELEETEAVQHDVADWAIKFFMKLFSLWEIEFTISLWVQPMTMEIAINKKRISLQ